MKKVTLVCAAGMSTSLLMAKMNAAIAELGLDVTVRATSESKFKDYETDTDILLLGPQVGYMLKKFKEAYEPKGIKVAVIDSVDYGMLNGKKVLQEALVM